MIARIDERLIGLQTNPRPAGSKKLEGSAEYRVRAGDYRIVYLIDDRARRVTVTRIRHRSEAYK
jgi:mRNA interferase RelE/StbE